MKNNVQIINPKTFQGWDQFVESHPYGWITHLSGWQSVLEHSFPHIRGEAVALLQGKELIAALPFYHVKSVLTGNRLVSVPFGTICDPLVTNQKDAQSLIDRVISQTNKAKYLEIRTLFSSHIGKLDNFLAHNFFKHHFLRLDRDPDSLKKSFDRTNVRQRINRSLKSDLILIDGSTEKDLRDFFNLHAKTRKRLGLPVQPYRFFLNLFNTFYSSGKLELLLTKYQEQVIAGVINFRFRKRVSIEFSVYDEQFRKFSPIHFLFWNTILRAMKNGDTILDFGRTSPNNTSLMNFKKRWGTEIMEMPQFYYPKEVYSGDYEPDRKFIYRALHLTCLYAPNPLYMIASNLIYKHLG